MSPAEMFGQNKYILYVVFSIMMILFISSCVAYGVHRLRMGDRKPRITSKVVMATYPPSTSSPGSGLPAVNHNPSGTGDEAFVASASCPPSTVIGQGQGQSSCYSMSVSVRPASKRAEVSPQLQTYQPPGRTRGNARNSLTSVESSDDLLGGIEQPSTLRDRSSSIAVPYPSSGLLELGVHFPGMADRRRSHQDNRRDSLKNESEGPHKSNSTNCLLPPEDNRLAPNYPRRASHDSRRPSRDARRASLHPRLPDDPDLGPITALRRSSVAPAKLRKKRVITID